MTSLIVLKVPELVHRFFCWTHVLMLMLDAVQSAGSSLSRAGCAARRILWDNARFCPLAAALQ